MTLRYPDSNEEVIEYDKLQTDEINRVSADVPKAYYGSEGWKVIEYPNRFVILQKNLDSYPNEMGLLSPYLPFRMIVPYSAVLTAHWSSTSDVNATIRDMFEDRFDVRIARNSDNSPISSTKQEVSMIVMGIRE